MFDWVYDLWGLGSGMQEIERERRLDVMLPFNSRSEGGVAAGISVFLKRDIVRRCCRAEHRD